MTEDEARRLATRIIDTWPSGAKAYIWRDQLQPLDHHTATVTYKQLTAGATQPPTPGTFMNAYRTNRARSMQDTITKPLPFQPEPLISLHEYLEHLTARARTNPTAADELECWQRRDARRRHPSNRDTPTIIGPREAD